MELKNSLGLIKTLQQAKELPRQGMLLSGLKLCETDTVASHSYSVTVFAYTLAKHFCLKHTFIDPMKTMEMALFHDIGEMLTGDIGRNVKKRNKKIFDEIEESAVGYIDAKLNNEVDIRSIIKAYNNKSFPYAWLIKMCDLLDAVVFYNSGYWKLKFDEADFSASEKKFLDSLDVQIKTCRDSEHKDFYKDLREYFYNAVDLIKSDKVKRYKF